LLHHVNIDRIFAMWQVLYPNSWIEPTRAVYASHTTSAGQVVNANTALTPFYFNETTFWTSDMVRNHQVFHYTYAEVASKDPREVRRQINKQYTHYSPATIAINLEGEPTETNLRNVILQSGLGTGARLRGSIRVPMDAIFDEDKYCEWIAQIHVEKKGLNSAYQIHLFLGPVPGDPSVWSVASNLVGILGISSSHNRHETPTDTTQQRIAGTVPLTSALLGMISAGNLQSLRPWDVEPYLNSQLKYRVVLINGTLVASEAFEALNVTVVSRTVKIPSTEDSLAQWDDIQSHFRLLS
jgi:tyrosinase